MGNLGIVKARVRGLSSFAEDARRIGQWVVLCGLLLWFSQCTQANHSPCRADSECLASQRCVAAACIERATLCPTQCSKDGDCALCDDSKTACILGLCVPKPACPGSCFKDKDCEYCDATAKSCVGGACGKSECANDANCPTGKKCIWQQCTAPGIGQLCNTDLPCPVGMQCFSSHCFQDCTKDESLCAKNQTDGRTLCLTAFLKENQAVKLCLGEGAVGQLCGFPSFNTPRQVGLCRSWAFPPEYCATQGTCEPAILQRDVGDSCNVRGDSQEPIKVCNSQGTSPLACSQKEAKCVLAKLAEEGEECDALGVFLEQPTLCKNNRVCIQFHPPYTVGRCHDSCDPSSPNACQNKKNTVCYRVAYFQGQSGVCLETSCTQDSDCDYKDYICSVLRGSSQKLCHPPVPKGQKLFGETCGDAACVDGLECLSLSLRGKGVCTQDCSKSICPIAKSAKGSDVQGICVPVGSDGKKQCVFLCKSNEDCPKELQCSNVEGTSICVPP